jgi:hypothetical protein
LKRKIKQNEDVIAQLEREVAKVKEERDYILEREANFKLEVGERESQHLSQISSLLAS